MNDFITDRKKEPSFLLFIHGVQVLNEYSIITDMTGQGNQQVKKLRHYF